MALNVVEHCPSFNCWSWNPSGGPTGMGECEMKTEDPLCNYNVTCENQHITIVASGELFGTTDQASFGTDKCAPIWSGTQWEWSHALGDCDQKLTKSKYVLFD